MEIELLSLLANVSYHLILLGGKLRALGCQAVADKALIPKYPHDVSFH